MNAFVPCTCFHAWQSCVNVDDQMLVRVDDEAQLQTRRWTKESAKGVIVTSKRTRLLRTRTLDSGWKACLCETSRDACIGLPITNVDGVEFRSVNGDIVHRVGE